MMRLVNLSYSSRLLGCRLRGSNLGPLDTAPLLEVAVKPCSSSALDIRQQGGQWAHAFTHKIFLLDLTKMFYAKFAAYLRKET